MNAALYRPRLVGATVALMAALAASSAHSHGDKHEHGVLHLDVAMDGNSLVIQLESPLDSVLGFERQPRNEAERQAVARLFKTLRQGDQLFQLPAAAGCRLRDAQLDSALSTSASATDASAGSAAGPAEGAEHLDIDATYTFTCSSPQRLLRLDHALFTSFPRLQRIDVQTAVAQGQGKQTLKRPAATIVLEAR